MPQKPELTSKDLFALLVSQVSEFVIVLVDATGLFISWNPGVESCLGYTAEEFIGKEFDLLLPYSDRACGAGERELKEATEKGRASDTRWLMTKNGERIWVDGVTLALRDNSGQLLGFGKILRNVTARLGMQQELETANQKLQGITHELERSNEDLEQFARIASHDLSAPITSTRWLVDALRMRHGSRLDPDGQLMVEQISQSLERMADLVDAVLAHALVGTSAIAGSELADAEDAFESAIKNLRKDIELAKAAISHDPLPRLQIEENALAQLFQNLLSNSIKYRRTDVPLSIRVTAVREMSMWKIGVHDNGMGIEREWFERIFQPFQRRHGLEIAGTGLGLATCKKIVTRAGGNIWVESKLGSGSSFFFTLPGKTA